MLFGVMSLREYGVIDGVFQDSLRTMTSVHTEKGKNDMELISKDDVIKALQKWNCRDYDSQTINPYKVLRDIPTIEERKEGEWVYESCSRLIDETDEGQVYTIEKRWHCSRCGFSKGFMMYRPDEKYCPNCGAKMERRADDNTIKADK